MSVWGNLALMAATALPLQPAAHNDTTAHAAPQNNTTSASSSRCTASDKIFHECVGLSATVLPQHVLAPWALVLATYLCLSLPTLCLRSRHQHRGLATLCGVFARSAATLLACCHLHSAAVVYTLSLHACMQLLLGVSTDHLVGGPALWSNRAWSCAALVAGAAWWGPRVSLVNWSGHDPVACAVHAHLLGCVLPQMTGSLVAGLANLVSALGARRD